MIGSCFSVRAFCCALNAVNVGFTGRTSGERFGHTLVPGCEAIRGAYELNVLGLKLVGLGAMRGAIDTFAIGLAAGAARVVTAREEPFWTLGLIPCPAAVWMLTEKAAIKQSAKNLFFLINCSAN